MNNVTPEKKTNVLKSLALIGLFAVVVLLAWLSVQIVKVMPSALTSLASLADSVYSYEPKSDKEIELQPINSPVISGDETTIAWNRTSKTGTYTLSYECRDGLSLDIKSDNNEFTGAECDKSYDLGSVDSTQVIVNSEKKGEVDLVYTVSYFKTNSPKSTIQTTKSVVIENTRLTTDAETITEEVEEPETPTKPEVAVETPTTPALKPGTPTTQVYTYNYFPVSDPKGFTDLEVTYIGIGEQVSGTFINTGLLRFEKAGAIQFAVRNIGTKTSDAWTFESTLPGDISYQSGEQVALKPNERAVLTFQFPAVSNTELQSFSIKTDTTSDKVSSNNSFTWSTIVIK